MTTLTVSKARANLYKLLDLAAKSHVPVQITGKRFDGVLVSAEDWRAIQETLHLVSVPGMKKSLLKAKNSPLKAYSKKRPW